MIQPSQTYFSFNREIGASKSTLGDVVYTCDDPDEVSFFYGTRRIFLKAHIGRALAEAAEAVEDLAVARGFPRGFVTGQRWDAARPAPA
jgi:hypothetical protein